MLFSKSSLHDRPAIQTFYINRHQALKIGPHCYIFAFVTSYWSAKLVLSSNRSVKARDSFVGSFFLPLSQIWPKHLPPNVYFYDNKDELFTISVSLGKFQITGYRASLLLFFDRSMFLSFDKPLLVLTRLPWDLVRAIVMP